MDTKQKNSGGEQERRKNPDSGKRPAREERAGRSALQQKKARTPQKPSRKAPERNQKSTAQRQTQRRPVRQERQPAPPPQTQQLPESQVAEEVYRPTPSQDRHSQEARSRTARPDAARTTARPAAVDREAAKRRAGKRSRPAGKAAGRRVAKQNARPARRNAPAVIYTQPAPFNLNRLLIQLLTVTAMVLAFTMALSIFFKVEYVTVSGADAYSEWTVRNASGIQEGDALLTFSRARAGARIRAELPYVDRVRFGIKLPNTVIIDIVELDVVYAVQDDDGLWWFVTSEGRVVEQTDSGTAGNYTKIVGIVLESPRSNETAVASEPVTEPTIPPTTAPGETLDPLATAPETTTNADRLAVALQIVRALEDNDVVGEVAKVDVSNLGSILLDYGTRFDVKLGNAENLEYKIASMCDAITQMSDYQTGVMDVSFSIWQDKVVVTPFDE